MAVFPPNILWCCIPPGVCLWCFDIPGGTGWIKAHKQFHLFAAVICSNFQSFSSIFGLSSKAKNGGLRAHFFIISNQKHLCTQFDSNSMRLREVEWGLVRWGAIQRGLRCKGIPSMWHFGRLRNIVWCWFMLSESKNLVLSNSKCYGHKHWNMVKLALTFTIVNKEAIICWW